MCKFSGKPETRCQSMFARRHIVAGHQKIKQPSRVALTQLDACIKQSTMCGCRKCSMLSLGDCSELTEARSPKTTDATREVDGNSFVDGCTSVYSNSCLTYRRENAPNLYPDAFSCLHVILKSVR